MRMREAAAADVADGVIDVAVARLRRPLQQRHGRHDLAGLAVAAQARRARSRRAAPGARHRATASIVSTATPSRPPTGTRQDRVASPFRCTVQAPHCAMPQPNFVPVRPSSSRSTHKSGVSGSTSSACFRRRQCDHDTLAQVRCQRRLSGCRHRHNHGTAIAIRRVHRGSRLRPAAPWAYAVRKPLIRRYHRSRKISSITRQGCPMLRGLDPLLTPDLLHALASMGHGDTIAVVDANLLPPPPRRGGLIRGPAPARRRC